MRSRIVTKSTVSHSDHALQNLRTLLEVNSQMARERMGGRLSAPPSEEARDVLLAATRSASHHRDELSDIIHDWEAHARGRPREEPENPEARLSTREFIESWIAIKESAVEIYKRSAGEAPTATLRRRLLDLAHEESVHAARLRELL